MLTRKDSRPLPLSLSSPFTPQSLLPSYVPGLESLAASMGSKVSYHPTVLLPIHSIIRTYHRTIPISSLPFHLLHILHIQR